MVMKITKSSNHGIVNKFWLFIYFFFMIFGTKIGVFDFTLFTGLLGILVILTQSKKINISRKLFKLLYYLMIVIFIAIISIIYNSSSEFDIILRYIRVLLNLISIYLVISNVKLNPLEVFEVLITVLFLNAVVIVIGALNVNFQSLISNFTGYSKTVRFGRSTGLTIGFDITGLLVVIGFLGTAIFHILSSKDQSVKLIVFSIAALLTTRFTMFLYIIVLLYVRYLFKKHGLIFETIIYNITLIVTSIISISLFTLSVSFGGSSSQFISKNQVISNVVNSLVESYASTNLESTLTQHYDFSHVSNWFIGDAYGFRADPGYTLTIYSIGVIGLIFSIVFYLNFMRLAIKKTNQLEVDLYRVIVLFWVIVVMLFNTKNSYFFTRNISETGFAIFFIYLKAREEFVRNKIQS